MTNRTLVDANRAVAALQRQTERGLDITELLRAVLVAFGGYQGIARCLYDTYNNAEDGSSTRASLMTNLMKLIDHASEGVGGEEGMSDEELTTQVEYELDRLREADDA